jgi:outer membrane immunogenic protein
MNNVLRILTFVGACTSGGAVMAADLPVRRAVSPPPVMAVPGFNWTGLYIGVNAGYGWASPDKTFLGLPDNGAVWVNYNPVVNGLADPDVNGFIGGGQAGYNFHVNSLVYGIEADLSYANIRGSRSTATTSLGGTPFTFSERRELNWFATVRGRLGWAIDRWLVYATGGLAVGGVKDSTNLSFVGCPCYLGEASSTKVGWTAGGGLEWAVAGNWSAKAEYLYYDLGDVRVTGVPTPAVGTNVTQTDFKTTGNIVRAGLNYRFGGPVVARY